MADPGVSLSRYLADGEEVVLVVRRHLVVLLRAFLLTVLVIVVASAVGSLVSPDSGTDVVDSAVGVIVLAFVARFLWITLQWHGDRIVVTDQRIFQVGGVFTRAVASMPLTKLTDMTYRRTLAGRLLGFGDLVLETAGNEQALSHIAYLPGPDHFYRTVTSLVAARLAPLRPEIELDAEPMAPRAGELEDTGPIPRVIV
jgi:uncharacterized membrane protein YdbT with pleckstrin-like domain